MGDIFLACKRGDLTRVRYLVEEMSCDINVADKWNSTPLYYACFSGYEEIVKYLLKSGAVYNSDGFDGERCMNGALTDTIRHVLRNPPHVCIPQRNTFREAMERLVIDPLNLYSDICIVVGNGNRLYAHKIILSSQSTYFEHLLHGTNRTREFVYFRHPKERSLDAWKQVLQYIYTQKLSINKSQYALYKGCIHLSRRLGIPRLTAVLRSQDFFSKFYKKDVETIDVEEDCLYYPDLADNALVEYSHKGMKIKQPFTDLCFVVQNYRFYCHKAFIVSHSEYFKALLDTDQFTEVRRSNRGNLDFITLSNVNASNFALILKFIYTNDTEVTKDTLHDLLYYSDHYMIPGLKLQCGSLLASLLTTANATQTLALARMLRMNRLQHAALRFIAYNFEEIYQDKEFERLLKHDESCLRSRRVVRVSESSLDQNEEEDLDEDDDNGIAFDESESVDMLMDLRMFLRENTTKEKYSITSQQREAKCVSFIDKILSPIPPTPSTPNPHNAAILNVS